MKIINVNKDNFKEEVLDAEGVVFVDFWATWCMPCKMFSEVLEDASKEIPDDVKVCKVNVDEQQDLAAEYDVVSIPTLLVVKNGKVIKEEVGVQSKEDLKRYVAEA